MAERCPLDSGLYWANGRGGFPEECVTNCEPIWEEVAVSIADRVDTFDDNCNHPVEHEDESLQRLDDSARRQYAILNVCRVDGVEAFAQEWDFDCPNN